MSPAGKQVWNLLRAYVAYASGLRTSTGQIVARSARVGEIAAKRVRCEPCLGTGHRRARGIEQRCDDCQGKGKVLVDPQTGKRPAHAIEPGQARMTAAELAAWESHTDLALTRIEALLKMNEGEEAAHDAFSSAYETGKKLMAQGSFPQLRLALVWLRDTQPALHSLIWSAVIYAPFGPPAGGVRLVCENVCDILAERIGGKLDVPGWAREAAEWRDQKESLWRGKRPEHDQQRNGRDMEVQRLRGEGMTQQAIGDELGLSQPQVHRILTTASQAVATVAA